MTPEPLRGFPIRTCSRPELWEAAWPRLAIEGNARSGVGGARDTHRLSSYGAATHN